MKYLIPLVARGEPLFRQVYVGLRQAILSGTFRAGDRLQLVWLKIGVAGNQANPKPGYARIES